MAIHVLPDHVANQIAAGEVVERPSSVVRELVDNAIDAGATDIRIELRAGGHALVRVTDNGSGMSKEDALKAFERHATSKLSTLSDLETLTTLGFRGEALPSIASVSKVRLTTRAKQSKNAVATEVSLVAGKLEATTAVAGPPGTCIEVSNLFFNTPARRKFLKTQRSEELRIKQWCIQYSLAHPGIQFALYFDEREVFREPARKSLEERARALVGASSVPVSLEVNAVKVQGLIAHPSQARGDAHALTTIVNGRLVSDRMLLRAAKDGFGSALKEREIPVGVLSLSLPGSEVDINVHPQKSEIRFRNSSSVYVAVLRAVQAAVSEFKSPAMLYQHASRQGQHSAERFSESLHAQKSPHAEVLFHTTHTETATPRQFTTLSHFEGAHFEGAHFEGAHFERSLNEEGVPQQFRYQDLAYRGQLFECYLLCEHNQTFYVLDMHAAHERYQYNQVRSAIRMREARAQQLLIPLDVSLSELGVERIRAHAELLEACGFLLEWPEALCVRIRAVPVLLQNKDVAGLMRELAMIDPEEGGGQAPLEYLIDQIAARIACHASIRSGKRMTQEEVDALLRLLDSSECSAACPHGRPVLVSFSQSEVERWFGRDR